MSERLETTEAVEGGRVTCRDCQLDKLPDAFRENKFAATGRDGICRECYGKRIKAARDKRLVDIAAACREILKGDE